MESRNYWEENGHAVKYENFNSNDGYARAPGCSEQLNFAAAPSEDEADYTGHYLKKGKVTRQDPMSHRIIEKRRRDRMNNCLADLSRLIPPEYLKKGRGRVEKTEIIEMAIRHLKFLQERAHGLYLANKGASDAAERTAGAEHFRAGYHEASTEAVRFLVEVQGYGPSDGLCVQLASHLQMHSPLNSKASTEEVRYLVEAQDKGGPPNGICVQLAPHLQRHSTAKFGVGLPDEFVQWRSYVEPPLILDQPQLPLGEPLSDKRPGGSSSETGSSSSLSHGYAPTGVIARLVKPPEPYQEPYEPAPEAYPMECDRVSETAITLAAEEDFTQSGEPLLLEAHPKREQTLRTVRKSDYADDYLHSYKFKNSIERRFSRSQDSEARDMTVNAAPREPTKTLHKRRRAAKPAPSTTTSNSGSTEDARDTSPQDTSSESPHHHYEKPLPTQFVPVFALNALGKYYVPVSVDYACLSRHLGPFDVLDARAAHLAAPLHPVTIHVNFQPCLNYHVKNERDWAAA